MNLENCELEILNKSHGRDVSSGKLEESNSKEDYVTSDDHRDSLHMMHRKPK